MKTFNKNIFLAIILISVFYSCSIIKKTPKKEVPKTSTETSIDENQQQIFEYYFIEGLKQKNLNNTDQATQLFSKCLEIDPQSAVAMFELANIHVSKGDYTSAALVLEKAISINPDNQWYKLMLAQVYQQSSQFDKAAVVFKQITDKNPNNVDYLFVLGNIFNNAGNSREALATFNLIEKKMGINDQLSIAKEQIYLKEKKNQKAIEELERLINSNPSESRYYGLLADLYLNLNNKIKALELYDKVLKMDPDNGFVYFSLANFYAGEKDSIKAFDEALLAFKNSKTQLDLKISFILMARNSKSRFNFTDQQIAQLVSSLVIAHPLEEKAFAFYTDYLLQTNKLHDAFDILKKGISNIPGTYTLWEKLLMVEEGLQDSTNLSIDSEKALNLFPEEPMTHLMRSSSLLGKGKPEESLQILEKGEQYIENDTTTLIQFDLQRAEIYNKMNRSTDAFAAYERILKMDPNNQITLNNYAYYLSEKNQDLEKAEKMASTVVQNSPTNSTFLDTYAWVLFKRQNYSLAKFYMESALSNGGDENAVLFEHYGDILIMLGEKDKAILNWNKSIEKGNSSPLLKKKIKEGKYLEN